MITLKDVEAKGKVATVQKFGRFTIAEVTYEKPVVKGDSQLTDTTKTYYGFGIARQGEGDRSSDEIGKNIAVSRAQKSCLRKLQGKTINSVLMG